MNFFEHHIGDYDEATSHLSAREDGMYCRLIRKYYAKEKPLPNDLEQLQRLCRCRDEEDRAAVAVVLKEFFKLGDDGLWHQKTCDENLQRYRDGEPEREVKKANEQNRVTKHRLERSRLFQVLVAAGQHAPWNTPIADLRTMAAAIEAGKAPPDTAGAEKPATPHLVSGAAPATPATATSPQSPVPSPQSPVPTTQSPLPSPQSPEQPFGLVSAGAGAPPAPPATRAPRRKRQPEEDPPKTAHVWAAYSTAYATRYRVAPVRNAKVNSQLSQVVDRLGAEAPDVAAFFLTVNGNLYVAAKHPTDLLLRDAEKLRTEWATGQTDAGLLRQEDPQARGAALAAGMRARMGIGRNRDDGEVIDV